MNDSRRFATTRKINACSICAEEETSGEEEEKQDLLGSGAAKEIE